MNRTQALLISYLDGMAKRGELVPGGHAVLVEQVQRTSRYTGSPAQALAQLVEDFATPANPSHRPHLGNLQTRPAERGGFASRYLNPEREVEPEAPLRAILRRFEAGGLLGQNKADVAYQRLAAPLAGIERPGFLASMIAGRLERSEQQDLLRVQPELPYDAQHVEAALSHFIGKLNPTVDTRALALKWGKEFAGHTPERVARMVADRLAMPLYAKDLMKDGQPLEFSVMDPIFRPSRPERPEGAPRLAGL